MAADRVLHWLSPGDPARRTGGFLYNARIAAELRALGWSSVIHRLDAAWPSPQRPPSLPELPGSAVVVADGLLLTAMAPALSARPDLRVVGLVHSPLWREGRPDLRAPEAAALRSCAAVIATSDATAAEVAADCGCDVRSDIRTVVPGTDAAALAAPGPGHRLLCPAHLVRRKGHDRLLDALDGLRHLPWTLTLAGSTRAEPATAAALLARAQTLGDRVRVLGEVDAVGMDAALRGADLVVLPSRYEAFGMVLTEAVARGVPVQSTPAGALPLLGDAAIETTPDRLAADLARWLTDPLLRQQRRAAATARAPRLPTWSQQARRFVEVVEGLC